MGNIGDDRRYAMIWMAFFILLAVALVLLLRPLLSEAPAIVETRPSELAVYLEQLRELDNDLSRELISPDEADAARNEVKRKMLAVAPAVATVRDPRRAVHLARAVVGAGVPLLAAGLYLAVGRPDLPGSATAVSAGTESQSAQVPGVDAMVASLAQRLKNNPDDAEGWRMLGRSYAYLEQFDEAANAFERAILLDGRNAALRAEFGDATVRAAGGRVTPQAEKIFDDALAIDPKEPRARYFRGLALEQHNKPNEALALWVKIIGEGPADAEWIPALRQRATDLAVRLKLDPAKEIPSSGIAGAPKVAQFKEAGGHADSAALVDRLNKRLKTTPKDYESWILLARTYGALGKQELGRAALARAKPIFSGAPFVLQQLAAAEADLVKQSGDPHPVAAARGPTSDDVAAASELSSTEQNTMIEGMIAGLEERLQQNPNDLEGWLMLARSRKVMDDAIAARAALDRAQRIFGGNAQARARIVQTAVDLGLSRP
jgi:cytochrome c-type biogenesis protein CcmH